MSTLNDIKARFAAGMLNEKRSKNLISQTNLDEITNPYITEKMENDSSFLNELSEFMFYLPEGLITVAFLDFLNKLKESESKELIKILNSLDRIEQIKNINYNSGLLNKLYKIEPKGVGRGEIMLSWIIKGAKINGGGESYDMSLNGKKYELKAATDEKSGVRTGKEGALTSKNFYKIIKDTLRRIENLTSNNKFDIKSILTDAEFSAWSAINEDDYVKINNGEISKTRIQKLKNFYEVFNKAEINDIAGYSNLILRGPNEVPKELSIEPISFKDFKPGDTITLKVADSSNNRLYVLTELRRLKYVRDPQALDADIQSEIDNLTKNKEFIIFRPSGAVITSNLRLSELTARTMKVIEA